MILCMLCYQMITISLSCNNTKWTNESSTTSNPKDLFNLSNNIVSDPYISQGLTFALPGEDSGKFS